ncbi:MAG TPA: DUF6090 family protein [Draconibacterium sp.]|nr:DUF6090 family protein [Draconibacterium sp.]
MLRLFRKIRLKLFRENKVSHYMLYALGEIILIVIGILIAMEIGNWNEQRKIRQLELVYLQGLQSEFEQSLNKLQTLIEVNKSVYEDAKKIADYITTGYFPEEQHLSILIFNAFSREQAYNPNNSLLNEIISAGYLKNITNPELRRELSSWESVIQGIHRQEATLREQRELVLDIFRKDTGSMRTVLEQANIIDQQMGLKKSKNQDSNLNLITSREFENNLLPYILTGMMMESEHYKPLLDRINRILQLLEEEIK